MYHAQNTFTFCAFSALLPRSHDWPWLLRDKCKLFFHLKSLCLVTRRLSAYIVLHSSAWLRLATGCYPSAPAPCVSGPVQQYLVQAWQISVLVVPSVDSESIAKFRVSNSDHDFFPIVQASATFERTEPAQNSSHWLSTSITHSRLDWKSTGI